MTKKHKEHDDSKTPQITFVSNLTTLQHLWSHVETCPAVANEESKNK